MKMANSSASSRPTVISIATALDRN